MSADERSEALLSFDITSIMYFNTDLDLQVISIINSPADRLQQKEWCIGQFGTRLSRGPEPIRFNRAAVCGDVVIPMREPYAIKLGLVYDASKIITAANCKLWPNFNPEKDFPGEGDLHMAVFPRGFQFGQGAVVPQSFAKLLDLIESDTPTILNGIPAPGLADAMQALQKNEYHSFFGKPKLYGMEKKDFHKEFKKQAEKPTFYQNMMVEEKNVTSQSPNGLQHSNLFVNKLNQAIQYAQIACPSNYEEAMSTYVTPAKTVTHKVKFRQYQDNDLSIDSDNSAHHRKRGKQEDINKDYMSQYYKFYLGIEVNENDCGPLQWMQQETMHPLFTKLKSTGKYISELQGLRTKWDKNLWEIRSKIYLQVPKKSLIWSHVLVKKLQTADWSTEKAGVKRPSQICVGVFTPLSSDQWILTKQAVYDVEMDGLLNQPAHKRSTIWKKSLYLLQDHYYLRGHQDYSVFVSFHHQFSRLETRYVTLSSQPTQTSRVS